MTFLYFIHLLSFSSWIGSIVFFSFIAAPAIFKSLPRETAGDVVAKIFPLYYQMGCICGVLALGSLALLPSGSAGWHLPRMISLGLMTLIALYSRFVIGPKVRQLKAEVRASSKGGSEHDEKSKRFSRLHGTSMILNMIVLVLGIVFLVLSALDIQGG